MAGLQVTGIRFRASDGYLSAARMGQIITQRMQSGRRDLTRKTDQTPHSIKTFEGMRTPQTIEVSMLSDFASRIALIIPEVIHICPGTFEMGSLMAADEMPVRTVSMTKPYAIGKYPVTVEEFRAFKFSGSEKNLPEQLKDPGKDRFPVVRVNWEEAMSYCEWLTKANGEGRKFRLPTEAEWEYAARGCRNFVYPWGNDPVAENAVFGGNALEQVGSRSENKSPFGVMDMCGNVLEWTLESAYNYDPEKTQDPVGTVKTDSDRDVKILRGGSWRYTGFGTMRSSYRAEYCQTRRADDIGFRVVEELPE